MPTGSINAVRLFAARRAIAALPSLTGSPRGCCQYRDLSTATATAKTFAQVLERSSSGSGSRRWLAQEAMARHGGGGPKYRNRTRNFKRDKEEVKPTSESSPLPPLSSETEAALCLTPEELVPGQAMLERIVKELKESAGSTFILPFGNADAIEDILEPFRRLASIGVKGEFIVRGCIARPELFKLITSKGEETIKVLSSVVEICGISYEDAIRLVGSYPEIVKQGDATTQLALEALIACGVPAGRTLGSVVKRCPPLVFARPADEIRQAAEALRDFFSRKQIAMIIQRCPQVLLKNIEETEEKYEYIFFQMGLDGEEFTQSSQWAVKPLEDIIQRHEFLSKCGRFRMPDAKHPQVKMENPPLNRILDSRDEHFATQVAQVSLEEWVIYRALCDKQAELAAKDKPFERVKPSMRKAYERRKKEAAEVPEHVLEDSTSGL